MHFEEEWYYRNGSWRSANEFRYPLPNLRMEPRLKGLAQGGISKNDFRKARAFVGWDEFMGYVVRIDGRETHVPHQLGHEGFAAGDAAGYSDTLHSMDWSTDATTKFEPFQTSDIPAEKPVKFRALVALGGKCTNKT